MEINITHMVNDADHMPFLSGSRAEHGETAAKLTWNNSKAYAAKHALITEADLSYVKRYFKSFGAWDDEEIAAWDFTETNALVTQLIAGDIREMEGYETFEEYEAAAHAGTVGGNIFRSGDQFYYYLGM